MSRRKKAAPPARPPAPYRASLRDWKRTAVGTPLPSPQPRHQLEAAMESSDWGQHVGAGRLNGAGLMGGGRLVLHPGRAHARGNGGINRSISTQAARENYTRNRQRWSRRILTQATRRFEVAR